jgi:hypothetical protein
MGRTGISFILSLTTSPNPTLQKIFSPRSFLASRLLGDGDSSRTIFLNVVFWIS